MFARFAALVLLVTAVAGCARLRFVIDVVPAVDELTETEVLRDDGAGWSAAKIALIDIRGLIVDAESRRILRPGENPVARFVESLRKAEADRRVKAIIVRINSPGGAVTATDVLYRELKDFKQRTSKPVVILMGDVAASGGYYLACGGDEIIAHPTTITGSIGVIIQTFNFSQGMGKIGIRADAITSGPNKAAGSPFEPMPPEHRALLQGLVDEFYDNFLSVVVENRPNLAQDDLAWISDGQVVTGRKAAQVGLIDRLGGLRDAFEAAKARAGVVKAKLVKYHRLLEHVGSAYSQVPSTATTQINLLQLNVADYAFVSPGFYYLWDASIP
ncbi:MAG: signal peptide peptidase SppA [Planctomycetes bacterium]|nr:signal peptide peptidase SppA [Planctomycetota bacterium]